MIVHFKKANLGKEQIKSELLGHGLGRKEALEGILRTKRRSEGLRKQIGCVSETNKKNSCVGDGAAVLGVRLSDI